MTIENNQVRMGDMMLTSPADTPYSFTIIIREAWPLTHPVCAFEIKGTDLQTTSAKMCKYELDNCEHKAYLDFFEKLSNDLVYDCHRTENLQIKNVQRKLL